MYRFAAAALVTAASAAVAASAPAMPQRLPIEARLEQAQKEAAAATAEQLRLEKLAGEARDDAARLHAQQLAAAQAIAASEARISAADAQARLASAQLSLQRQRLAREQAPLRSLLAALVLTSRRPPILLLADSGSAEELVKLRVLIEATTPTIRAKAAALTDELDRASRLRRSAAAAAEDMRRSRNELVRSRNAFAELEAQALALADRRGSRALGAGDLALARSEGLADARESVPSARAAAAEAAELAKLGPATLPRDPVAASRPSLAYRLPAAAAVVDGLGEVSDNGVRSRGVTLATRRGSRLVAPAAGTIVFAGPFRDYDGVIIIDHGSGWKSVLVNAGTQLAKGDRVALGERLGVALGPVEVQLHNGGEAVSPALIARSSATVSNAPKDG